MNMRPPGIWPVRDTIPNNHFGMVHGSSDDLRAPVDHVDGLVGRAGRRRDGNTRASAAQDVKPTLACSSDA